MTKRIFVFGVTVILSNKKISFLYFSINKVIMSKEYNIWLRDIYGTINNKKIFNSNIENLQFYRGNELFYIINRYYKNLDGIITLVIPGLRNIYYKYRDQLSEDDIGPLQLAFRSPLPSFDNLEGDQQYSVDEYLMPYDVVHITVRDFALILQEKSDLTIMLYPTEVKLKFLYDKSDFWNSKAGRIVDKLV